MTSLGAQLLNTQDETFQAYLQEAILYRNQDRIDEALETLDKASKWAEDQQDEKGLIDCYHYFALIYQDLGKKETGQFYWERANLLLNQIEYPMGRAFHRYIEARVLFDERNYFMALNMISEAKQSTNDRNLLNNLILLEGDSYLQIGKLDLAETNYNALLVNTDPLEKEFLQARAYMGLARLRFDQGDYQQAISSAESALALASEEGFSALNRQTVVMLSGLYETTGQLQEALLFERRLANIKDSVYSLEKAKAEAGIASEVEFKHLNQEIRKQDEEIVRLNKTANRSELTVIFTSIFLTIISLLAVSLYRNNQIKLKTNDLLHTKNRELQAARDAAVQAMEAKTNFLSTVSHELRTPLYAVTGLTHLLLEENPSDSQKEHLKALKFSGDYLLNFINDILQINKIDADKLEPIEVECSLKKILVEVLNSLQQTAKENRTELVLDFDPRIPGLLKSDPLKLSQIFINLVGNALKFTKGGEVKVIAKLLGEAQEQARIYFEVRDNGIGIDAEQQAKIFDSFEQGSVQINREYGGTGLGLTIVKSLLGLFGSKIYLRSELGKGSSFYFELDFTCQDHSVSEQTFEVTNREYTFEDLHLLVVEDNKINQVITKKMLAKKEITCDIANNGTEAVDLARTKHYDGILMDIHMPGISGVEATEQIRTFNPDIPIIALTAISLDDSLETFYAAGCNDVVTKPFKPEVFYQKIGENIVEYKLRKTAT
ncbi:ATP-binding protein [Robiginitalea sp. M366]|uniref:tetratricopeptide repeat-containing hybrid sensor histidine kinase/response regulator n=1 Tax=Robiginitalea aestuariiviva TaxID=3036903 RepID=UPI00240CE646|nr:ATP-binding protein [Robiginitalea aestuariiviva]MDG1570765.1 ATP-binding protein [Robiginitalea aestuariiviva]